MHRRILATTVALGTLVPVAPAASETYSVFSCHSPLGVPNAAAGWSAMQSGAGATHNGCASGGALVAALPGPFPSGNASATWLFDAPAGTRVVRVAAQRVTAGLKKSDQTYDVAYALETNFGLPGTSTLESCAPSTQSSCVADLTEPVEKSGLNGARVSLRVLCTNSGGTCSGPLSVSARQLNVGLEDAAPPTVSGVRLLDDGDSSGVLTVGFSAGDVGGGLFRTIVKVDGKLAATTALGTAPCADVAPADADAYQFDVPLPCPLVLTDGTASIDVRSLPAGPHGVELAVEDAAGNQTVVYGPVEFPRPNVVTGSSISPTQAQRAQLRMWFVKARGGDRRQYTSRFGTRVVTRGRLSTRTGRGIQGARIDVFHIRRDGTRRLLKTGLKTRESGRLTLILPLDVDTRTIEFAYRALRPGPITSRQRLRLTVRTNDGSVYYRSSATRR